MPRLPLDRPTDRLTAEPARLTSAHRQFLDTFGRTPDAAIAAMNAAGDDVACQAPAVRIGVQRVGVTRTSIPVTIVDPFDAGRTATLSCTVAASASLSANRRGLHVSRIGDLLAHLSQETFPTLRQYVTTVCAEMRVSQQSEAADVEARGVLSYVERVEGTQSKRSIEHLELNARALETPDGVAFEDGVAFHHVTACPCVQQMFKHSVAGTSQDLLDAMSRREVPALTHTQRCRSEVRVRWSAGPLPLRDWLGAIDSVVTRCLNTMPREIELHTVYRAHAKPQFLEDVLRDLLAAFHLLVRPHDPAATIVIRGTSMESIHDFDLSGDISATIADLDRLTT